jgi:hypothetical protein
VGNITTSNITSTFTGNLIGNTTVFGNLFAPNIYANLTTQTIYSNLVGNITTSNITSTFTGNLIGNTTVFGNLFATNIYSNLTTQTIYSNLVGNITTSNITSTFTGNLIGNTTVFGNLFAPNIYSNLTTQTIYSNLVGNITTSNITSTFTGNLIGNTTVFGNIFAMNVYSNLVTQQDVFVSNTLIGGLAIVGSLSVSANVTLTPSGSNITVQGMTNPFSMGGALSDETTTITTSSILTIRSPYTFSVRSYQPPYFWLNTLPADYVTFDILKNSNSIYSAPPTILSSYTNTYSTTSNTGTLIGGVNTFAQGDLIQFKVKYAGSSGATGAKGVVYFS